MMTAKDCKQYNKRAREIGHAKCFVHSLEHAMQKSGNYDECMHQLKCIGWSNEVKSLLCEALECLLQHENQQLCLADKTTQVSYPQYYRNFIRFEVDGEESLGEYTILVENKHDYQDLKCVVNGQSIPERSFKTLEGFAVTSSQIVSNK